MGRIVTLVSGLLLGVVALAVVRWVAAPPPKPTHYHANWAIFVKGERLDLSAPRYMEEVTACVPVGQAILPMQRTHMHDSNQDVVHVHHDGVTWGHLMANLGFGIGDNYLVLEQGERYVAGGEQTLKYIADSTLVLAPHNRVIRSTERLLISYGSESVEEVLETQFPQVATTAAQHNTMPDPAGCGGAAELTLTEKVRYALLGR